jgi:hypothetical protein
MSLPDGLPDRKELYIFKAIYLLKGEIFVWGVDQPDHSLCPDHCIKLLTEVFGWMWLTRGTMAARSQTGPSAGDW